MGISGNFLKKIFWLRVPDPNSLFTNFFSRLGMRDIQVATPHQNSLGGLPPRLNLCWELTQLAPYLPLQEVCSII